MGMAEGGCAFLSFASLACNTARTKQLWEEFFSDPSQWWDNRSDDKRTNRPPDFKHKTAKKALWIDNRCNPPWVHVRLAEMVDFENKTQSSFSISGISVKVTRIEQLWQEFFSDPSQWWDNKFIKKSPKYPDFKHKITNEGLWIEGWMNPPWVKARFSSMGLDQKQSGARVPNFYEKADNVSKLCGEGQLEEALHIVECMVQQNTQAPNIAFVSLLKGCARKKALVEGKQVHSLIAQSERDSDIFLGNFLVDMYVKCGSVVDARKLFNTMPKRNVYSWTAMISAYAHRGQGEEAINLFQKMQKTGIAPDKVAFTVVLKACASIAALEMGKMLHLDIIKSGFESDVVVGNTLIDMYAKCGCIEDACEVFSKMSERDVVSWNAMITGYSHQGLAKKALGLYEPMKQQGVHPDRVTYVVLLKACASIAALEQGKQLHCHLITSGFESDVVVGNTLVDMYAKCGCIEHAHKVFVKMKERDVVSWNAMIAGFAQEGLGKVALSLYKNMKQEGLLPDNVTYLALLKACASIADLEEGKQLHSHLIASGFELDVVLCSALVDMYAKCGDIEHASQVFNTMRERNVVSWNVMITGYTQQGLGKKALSMYEQMKQEGLNPDCLTYVVLLKACASIAALEQGKCFHSDIIKNGFESDVVVRTALVDMYAKCGSIESAHAVLSETHERDVGLWNAMIAGYVHQGLAKKALALYEQMKKEGMQADSVTFSVLLKGCASIAALEQGKELHFQIIKTGLESDLIVGNALVSMYAKCGCMENASNVFLKMNEQDVVSWNAMITGYAQQGLGEKACALYEQMKQQGVQPDNVTYAVLIKACASIAALDQGKQIHFEITRSGLGLDMIMGSALVDMYAKCGCIQDAREVFNKIDERDVISWTAMIAGYAQQGLGKEALALLEQMQTEGIKPNEVTFVSVLSACSHSGLVDEACDLFDSMYEVHGITPTMDHYACMVDLLGRAGFLTHAEDFIQQMPIQPNAVVWMTLLGAASNYGHVEIGRRAFDFVVKLEPENDSAYVLLSNIYAAGGTSDEVAEVRHQMKDAGLKKNVWLQLASS